jgi:hypothetical protein
MGFWQASGGQSIVPDDIDNVAVAPFIYLMLAILKLLARDPAVRQYASAVPEGASSIRALTAAAAAAGTRVRDTGRMRGSFDEHIGLFTPEEIWVFDLAFDVIAMFASLGGLEHGTRAMVIDDVKSLDRNVSHHWKKEVRKAEPGPVAFQALRAHVPHHKPHR